MVLFWCVVIILLGINFVYIKLDSKPKVSYEAGQLLAQYQQIAFDDCNLDTISIQEIQKDDTIRLVWDIKKDKDITNDLGKLYCINTLVDGINIAKMYNMELKDAIYVYYIWYGTTEEKYIEDFLNSVIVDKYGIKIDNVEEVKKNVLFEYNKHFDVFFEQRYNRDYFETLADRYIGDEMHYLPYVDAVQYIQLYEGYYLFYPQINDSIGNRNRTVFLENSLQLYCYVGEFTVDEICKKFACEKKEKVEKELKDAIGNMPDMFGNYSENQYLKSAIAMAREIGWYDSELLKMESREEYAIETDDLEWAKNVFWEYMNEKIYSK